MKNVVILCGNLRGNLGDYAILDATVKIINKEFTPESIIISFHSFTGVDEKRTKIFKGNLDKNVSFHEFTPYKGPIKISKFFRKVFVRFPFIAKLYSNKFYQKVYKKLKLDTGFNELLSTSDLTVIAGGGQYGSIPLSSNMLAQIELATTLSKRVVSFPQSIPLNWFNFMNKKKILNTVERLNFFSLRDRESFNYINELDLNNIYQFADIVFSLKSEVSKLLVKNVEKKIGILFANTGTRVGEKYAVELNERLNSIVSIGYTPVIITTTEGVDNSYLNDLKSLNKSIEIRKPNSWQSLVGNMSDLDLVITNRFHGVVFSILSNIPVIPLIDVDKTESISKLIGYKIVLSNEKKINKKFLLKALSIKSEIISLQEQYLLKVSEEHSKIIELINRNKK